MCCTVLMRLSHKILIVIVKSRSFSASTEEKKICEESLKKGRMQETFNTVKERISELHILFTCLRSMHFRAWKLGIKRKKPSFPHVVCSWLAFIATFKTLAFVLENLEQKAYTCKSSAFMLILYCLILDGYHIKDFFLLKPSRNLCEDIL